MMVKISLIASVLCLLLNFMVCEIRFAFSFWRHGARAPDRGVNALNIDLLGEEWSAPGELTPSGMRMHYLLGARNRQRWNGFLSSSYDNKELYVKSTDYNRTIMSVMSHLQGLYPAGSGPTLTSGQSDKAVPPVTSALFANEQTTLAGNALPNGISVIPVHLFAETGAYFFYYNPYICSPIKDMFAGNAAAQRNVDLLKTIKDEWGTRLKVALSINDDSFFDNFGNMYLVADSFVASYTDDRALPSFTNAGIDLDEFLDVAHEFEFHNIFYLYNGDSDMWFSRIVMTPFFEDVFRWMDTRIANDVAGKGYTGFAAPKVVLYSGHDVTLGAAQTFLKRAFSTQIPQLLATPYASSFIWELYRPDGVVNTSTLTESDYTVKITYNNDEDYLEVSYPVFKNTINDYMLSADQLDKFCGFNQSSLIADAFDDYVPSSYLDATIVLSVLLFLAVIGLIVLLVLLIKKNKAGQVFPTENRPVTTV